MCDEWRLVFALALLCNEAQYFCSELQHLGGKALGAVEGFLVNFDDGWGWAVDGGTGYRRSTAGGAKVPLTFNIFEIDFGHFIDSNQFFIYPNVSITYVPLE